MSRVAGLSDLREPFGDLDLSAFINTASYVVFTRDVGGVPWYYAKNGQTGQIQFSGTNAITVIQAGITAGAGGRIYIKNGVYPKTVVTGITVPDNTEVYLDKNAIIRLSDNVGNSPYIFRCVNVANIKIVGGILDGNRVGQTITTGMAYGIHWENVTDSWIEGVTIRDISTSDALSGYGIYTNNSPRNKIEGNNVDNCSRENIVVYNNSNDGTIINNLSQNSDAQNIVIHDCDNVIVSDNIALSAGTQGILIIDDGTGYSNTCSDNMVLDSVGIGILVSDNIGLTCSGNTVIDSGGAGIELAATVLRSLVTDNTLRSNTGSGVVVKGDHITISSNVLDDNGGAGGGYDNGVTVTNTATDISILGNVMTGAGACRYGVNVFAGALRTRVLNNDMYDGMLNGSIYDAGTGTILASKTFQFTEPIVGAISTTSPTGVDVDAATEGALLWGQLPIEVQQIVRIKVWAVATAGPIGAGGQMHLAATFNAGASNAAYNTATKSWTLANFDGEEADYVANDVVHWVIEDGDVGNELKNLLAGDSFELFALYNAGADPDGATDAVFRCIEIEYV